LETILIVVGHGKENDILAAKLVRKLIQMRNSVDAGRTPGSPKLKDDNLTMQSAPLPIETRRRLKPLRNLQSRSLPTHRQAAH
jgi:hypothetical protein